MTNYTHVLVGAYANTPHRDRGKIGSINWIWWEIEQSNSAGNRLIAVKLSSTDAAATARTHLRTLIMTSSFYGKLALEPPHQSLVFGGELDALK